MDQELVNWLQQISCQLATMIEQLDRLVGPQGKPPDPVPAVTELATVATANLQQCFVMLHALVEQYKGPEGVYTPKLRADIEQCALKFLTRKLVHTYTFRSLVRQNRVVLALKQNCPLAAELNACCRAYLNPASRGRGTTL